MKETIAKLDKTKSWFCEKIKQNRETVSQIHQEKKKEKTENNKIRNKNGEIAIDNTEIKMIIRDYDQQLYAIKWKIWKKWTNS